MKTLLKIFTLSVSLLICSNINAQTSKLLNRELERITLIPESPNTNDSILLRYHAYSASTPFKLIDYTMKIQDFNIDFVINYYEGPFTMADERIDTFPIGKLPKGDYILTVTTFLDSEPCYSGKHEFTVTSGFGIGNEVKNDFTLFPNPSTNKLKIEGDFGISKVEIMTLAGQSVKSYVTNKQEIDISSIAKGSYILLLTDKFGKKHSQKFIKQ